MSLPQWSAEDSLGDPKIDDDHRRLLDLLHWLESELYLQHDMDLAKVEALAQEFSHHFNEHFAHEEALMDSLSGLSAAEKDSHVQDHNLWRLRIQEYLPSLLRARTDLERRAHLVRILRVGKEFWEQHFQVHDRRLHPHIFKT